MMKPSTCPVLRLHDIESVAALIARGIAPTATEWAPDGERCYFVFRDEPMVSEVLGDFTAGRLTLEASAAFRAFRAARRVLRGAVDRRGPRR